MHTDWRRWSLTAALVVVSAGFGAPATAQPAEPPAPPVVEPGELRDDQCAPPSTTVVTELPWAQQRLLPQRVWSVTRGEGVVVGVVDSGVDGAVPQLAGRVLPGFDAVRRSGAANTDCVGHGTFVAGIIAAAETPDVGFAGIAPRATILPVRQADGGQSGTADTMARAIAWAVDQGAEVVNVSASSKFTSPALEAAVSHAAERDVLIVAAASNRAEAGNPKAYPAAYPQVLAVGAVAPDGKRSEFSETGGYLSLVAPGSGVLSTGPRGPGHLVGTGTSFAAPFVSGVAALVRAHHPQLSAAGVKRRLELTADHPSTTLPDQQFGWGVVNPYAAVTAMLPEERPDAEAAPVTVPGPAWPPGTPAGTAVAVAVSAGLALLGVVVVAARFALPAGRRRGWQPAGRPSSESWEESR